MLFINTLLANPVNFFITVSIVIVSVMLHELAHGFMALSQGDDTPRVSGHLTLNPLRLISWQSLVFLCITGVAWGQMPVNPTRFRLGKLSSLLVLMAGPFANLAIGLLLIELYKGMNDVSLIRIAQPGLLLLAARINLILFLLNLIPVPPLDGFQLICEIIPALRVLQRTRLALFVLMILLLIPAFGTGLTAVAQSIIRNVIV